MIMADTEGGVTARRGLAAQGFGPVLLWVWAQQKEDRLRCMAAALLRALLQQVCILPTSDDHTKLSKCCVSEHKSTFRITYHDICVIMYARGIRMHAGFPHITDHGASPVSNKHACKPTQVSR